MCNCLEKIEIVLQRLSYIKTERKTKEDMVMANFFDEKGKQLSEEELQEAAGGVVIAKSLNVCKLRNSIIPSS